MSKFKMSYIVLSILSLYSGGCGSAPTADNTAVPLGTLNSAISFSFAGAAALGVTSGSSGVGANEIRDMHNRSATSFGNGQLLSMDSSGNLTPMHLFSDSAEQATGVYDVSNFVAVPYKNSACSLVLARKSDSALFCAETSDTSGAALKDGSGNMYYRVGASSGWNVQRVILTDPSNPQKIQINTTAEAAYLQSMAVNSVGDVALSMSGSASTPTRMAHVGGGSTNFTANPNGVTVFNSIPGSNDFYEFEYPHGLKKATRQGGGSFTLSSLDTTTFTGYPSLAGSAGGVCQTADDVFVLNAGNTDITFKTSDLHRIVNNAGTVGVAAHGFSSVSTIGCGSNGSAQVVYVQGADSSGNSMIRAYSYTSGGAFSPSNGTDALNGTTGLTIYAMAVQSDGTVLINALRNSDGAIVAATLPAGGGTPTITSTSMPKLSALLPL